MAAGCAGVLLPRTDRRTTVKPALNLKGIEYESHAVNLLAGEQLSEEHLKVNKMGELPALRIDGVLLTQSVRDCVLWPAAIAP